MSKVGDWIRTRREEIGLTRDGVARKAGVSVSTVVRTEGDAGKQKRSTLIDVAKAIGLPGQAASSLAEWAKGKIGDETFHARLQSIPLAAPTVSVDGTEFVVGGRDGVPILGEVTAGGMVESTVFEGDEPEVTPIAYPGSERVYGLRIRGDSMAPEYRPGEILIVEDATPDELEDGDDAVIQCDGSKDGCSTFKRCVLLGNGIVRLMPLNTAYNAIDCKIESIVRIGKVLGVYRPKAKERAK